jgi:hypothetical protein
MNGAETRIHVSYSELQEIKTMDTRESFQHTLVVTPALAGFEYRRQGISLRP